MDKKTKKRYFDYILTYANTILEMGEELEKRCKKSRGGDVIVNRKKYMYFATTSGVTLVDKKTTLELTFSFIKEEEDSVYFEKEHLHSFIESDLNVSGLGKDFPTNSTTRSNLFNECLEKVLLSGKIKKLVKGFTISHKEIY